MGCAYDLVTCLDNQLDIWVGILMVLMGFMDGMV